jgi:hypothetical protein
MTIIGCSFQGGLRTRRSVESFSIDLFLNSKEGLHYCDSETMDC